MCQAWLGPPRELHAALHPMADLAALGDGAIIGLTLYGVYLLASAVVVGRSAANA